MGKLITVDSFNILTKETKKRTINTDHIVEIVDMISYDGKPISRIILSSGGSVDVQKTVELLTKEFEM